MLFNGLLRRRLRATKVDIRAVLQVPHDSDEKVMIYHANCLKTYHTNEFMSSFRFYQSKQCISQSNNANDTRSLTQTAFMYLSKCCRYRPYAFGSSSLFHGLDRGIIAQFITLAVATARVIMTLFVMARIVTLNVARAMYRMIKPAAE
jgi:hypothetical protein